MSVRSTPPITPSRERQTVAWHDLECGAYRVDLPLWSALARSEDGPVLDVGAGTGRVSLALARAGHTVTAVDREPALLAALARRAAQAGLAVETVHADARDLTLDRRDFALCVVPMQTIQLLGGGAGRRAFLRGAREHVRAGGLIACAILGALEPFDCAGGRVGPTAERSRDGEIEYVSRATRVAQSRRAVTIERARRIVWRPASVGRRGEGLHAPETVELAQASDVVELDRLTIARLRRDARAVDLLAEDTLTIAATDEHVGGTVVTLRV